MSLINSKKNSFTNPTKSQNKQLPLIERNTFHPKSTHKKFSSLDFRLTFIGSHHRRLESLEKQRSITNQKKQSSYLEKLKSKENDNGLKMEKSVLRFKHKQNLLFKTTMQKKKQKKMFSVQSLRNEQMQYFNSLQRHNLTKEDTVQQEHTFRQFPLSSIPSICYDSQFVQRRQSQCLTILNGRLYLFGGAVRRKFSYIPQSQSKANVDLLFHSYDDDRWVRQPVANQVSSDKKNLIHHSVNSVNKKYIVMAGGMMGDSQKTLSKFSHAILVYNTETKKMCEIPWQMSIRSHASTSFCNCVVLHGGKNEEGRILNQLHMLTINTNILAPYSSSDNRSCANANVGIRTWKFQTNQTLINHAIISTLDQQKSFRIGLRENNGLIVFGGESADGKMDSHLKIMKVYSSTELQRKLYKGFEIIKTYGQPPCPRKCHSLNLISSKNSLVVMGGLDQKCNPLADIYMLQLIQMKWSRIQTDPSIDIFFGGVYHHSTASTNTCLFIFGGKYVKDVGNSNFLKIDFNFDTHQKKNRQRKGSQISKGSSMWSIAAGSKQHLGTSDKILCDD